MIDIKECPICQSIEWRQILKITDHSVSRETFQLQECNSCSLLATLPRPNDESLRDYYKSDNYISHSGKANNLINHIYLIVRAYSLKWKLKLINSLKQKGKILDIGCGTGEFLAILKKNGWYVNGIEPNPSAREKASKITSAAIKEYLTEINDLHDVITLWHVLEHLSNLEENLQHISRCLTQSGTLLIAVPNHRSWDAQYYKENWAAYDVPRHLWHFNQSSMVLLLRKHGFKLLKTVPMKLDAFYVSILSEKYKGNRSSIFNVWKGMLSGLNSNLSARKTGEYSSLIYVATK